MLEDLKDELDLESFFKTLGVTKIKRLTHGYSMRCLHPDHNDSGPSFHYRTNQHKFKCYGCGFKGDVIDIVQVVKDLSFRKSIAWLKEFGGWSATTTTKQLEAIIERREKHKTGVVNDDSANTPVVIPAYFESDFSIARDSIKSYLQRRAWDVSVLADYGVGYCKHGFFGDRIIFPVFGSDDRLNTFAARATWDVDEGEERYLYPKDSFLSKSIWPLNMPLDGTPIFLEGCPDAMRLREYGYNAYACLGNQLGEVKLDIIRGAFRNHDRIIIVPDGDKGGEFLFQWFGKLIHEFHIDICRVESCYSADGKLLKDIDEVGLHLGREKVEEILAAKVPYQDVLIEKKYQFPEAPKMVTELVKDQELAHDVEPSKKFSVMNQLYWSAR